MIIFQHASFQTEATEADRWSEEAEEIWKRGKGIQEEV